MCPKEEDYIWCVFEKAGVVVKKIKRSIKEIALWNIFFQKSDLIFAHVFKGYSLRKKFNTFLNDYNKTEERRQASIRMHKIAL